MTLITFGTINESLTHVGTQVVCVHSFTEIAERECSGCRKESVMHSLDCDTQLKSIAEIDREETYVLQNGNFSTVGAERFRCVEVLLPESMMFLTNTKCDVHIRNEMYVKLCCQMAPPCSKGFKSLTRN